MKMKKMIGALAGIIATMFLVKKTMNLLQHKVEEEKVEKVNTPAENIVEFLESVGIESAAIDDTSLRIRADFKEHDIIPHIQAIVGVIKNKHSMMAGGIMFEDNVLTVKPMY